MTRIAPPPKLGRIYFLRKGVYSPAGWLARELGLPVEEDYCIYLHIGETRTAGELISEKLEALGITLSPKQVWEYIQKWDRIDDDQKRRYTFLTDAYNIMSGRLNCQQG